MKITSFRDNPALLEAFVRLPGQIYRHDPCYIAPLYSAEKQLVSPASPLLAYGCFRHFLLYCDSELCGRVTASYLKPRGHAAPQGALGFFEVRQHAADAAALLEAALGWLKGKGISRVTGPLNFTTYHTYRFVTKSSKLPPFLLEPYHLAVYPRWFQQVGFSACHHYLSALTTDLPAQLSRNEAAYRDFLKSGGTFRTINKQKFKQEIELLYSLSCRIFCHNPLYTHIPFPEFRTLYSGNNFLLEKELVLFALDATGREIGFVFGLPDYSENVRRLYGKKGLRGLIRFLQAGLKKRRCICKTFGRLPEAAGVGVGSALLYEFFRRAIKLGYRECIAALIHEANTSARMFAAARTIREYTLYENHI